MQCYSIGYEYNYLCLVLIVRGIILFLCENKESKMFCECKFQVLYFKKFQVFVF